jgi:hypothetical protein
MRQTIATRAVLVVGLGLLVLAAAGAAAALDMQQLIAPYRRALDDRAVGEVSVHVYGDPPRPSAPDVNLDGVSVVLLPYSGELDAELDGIKRHLRDSLKTYLDAVPDVTTARTTHEQAMLWAGGGELIRGEVSDARGLARLAGVPAGEWLLLAWRSERHPGKVPKLKPQEVKGFRDIPISTGHTVVTYWRMRLEIHAGELASVSLNDRNVWMTGVQEELHLMQGAPKRTDSKKRGQ